MKKPSLIIAGAIVMGGLCLSGCNSPAKLAFASPPPERITERGAPGPARRAGPRQRRHSHRQRQD